MGRPARTGPPSVPSRADSASVVRFHALSASWYGLPRYLRFSVKLLVTVAPFWIFTVATVGW